MGFFKRRSSAKQNGLDPKLFPFMLPAAISLAEKKAQEVKYDVKQSTLTREGWNESEGRWPKNTQTEKNHENTEKYVRRLVQKMLGQKSPIEALTKLAEDLDLEASPRLLADLLSWPVLAQEFASFKQDYRGNSSGQIEKPKYRMVRQEVQKRMPSSLLQESSVAFYRVNDGYRGQPLGFWSEDNPRDVAHQYTHMILRAMWRLWTDAFEDPKMKWLRNPGVVGSVDAQVYMLYHALLYHALLYQQLVAG